MAGSTGINGFTGFSLFDPSSWVPTFGLWGGPGWSAGERVAVGYDVLQNLHQQLGQVLQGLRGASAAKP